MDDGTAARLARARNGLASAPEANREREAERLAELERTILAEGLDLDALVYYDDKYGHWVSGKRSKK